MVDVSGKAKTRRVARASGVIRMSEKALAAVASDDLPKGDALAAARIAGILAAKDAARVIPLCHPLPIDHVAVTLEAGDDPPRVEATAEVVVTARTGAEMEALAAVSAALLTIYDMAKSLDRGMVVEAIRLDHKSGGASGDYDRGADA